MILINILNYLRFKDIQKLNYKYANIYTEAYITFLNDSFKYYKNIVCHLHDISNPKNKTLFEKIHTLTSLRTFIECYIPYKIENLPEQLKRLHLRENYIVKIENIPEGLHTLDLTCNKISKIENLPKRLRNLELTDNKISKIENLPDNLRILKLGHNKISKIENLPENLRSLSLEKNNLSELENLPDGLRLLDIRHNNYIVPLKESNYKIIY